MGNTEIFETMANAYDTPERIEIANIISDALRGYIVKGEDKSAIDFGCGTGLVGLNLINEFQSMLFIDTAQNMLEEIKKKFAAANIQNGDTLCYDFEEEFRSDIKADYIIMAQVLLHIKDIDLVLTRLYDLLKQEGHLLIVDFDKNEAVISDRVHNGFDQEALKERMAKIGFKEMISKTFYSGKKIFMNQDASLFILDAVK